MNHYRTVADLITALQMFPPDAPVRIDDNDTSWLLPVTRCAGLDGYVLIGGEYYPDKGVKAAMEEDRAK